MRTVLLLTRDQFGDGDADLGRKVLGTFLRKCTALDGLEAVLFVNAGARLVAPDSPVLAELHLLEERGVELVPCGTCLAHYGITPEVGEIADMDTVVRELSRAEKVISP